MNFQNELVLQPMQHKWMQMWEESYQFNVERLNCFQEIDERNESNDVQIQLNKCKVNSLPWTVWLWQINSVTFAKPLQHLVKFLNFISVNHKIITEPAQKERKLIKATFSNIITSLGIIILIISTFPLLHGLDSFL